MVDDRGHADHRIPVEPIAVIMERVEASKTQPAQPLEINRSGDIAQSVNRSGSTVSATPDPPRPMT